MKKNKNVVNNLLELVGNTPMVKIDNIIWGNNGLCVVCWNNQRNIAFTCGHVSSCHICSQKLNNCPICRSPTKKKLRVYFP